MQTVKIQKVLKVGDLSDDEVDEVRELSGKKTILQALYFNGDLSYLEKLIKINIEYNKFFVDLQFKYYSAGNNQNIFITVNFDTKRYTITEGS